MSNLIQELRRRNIFRVAGVYAVVGWILIQLGIAFETSLNLPSWFDTFLTTMVLIGFPIALLLAWAFELTPEGMQRTEVVAEGDSIRPQTGRKMDIAIMAGLALVVILIVGNRLLPKTTSPPPVNTATSIAVLPFADMSQAGDQEYFSDGMAEEILNALVRVPDLQVAGRTSSFAFKGQNTDLREIAATLNVSHILEGSVRKQGENVRITAQLIRAEDGFHMWSETYDGTLENIFDLQEDISRAIAGELTSLLSIPTDERLADIATTSTEAYDLLLRAKASSRNQTNIAAFDESERLLREALAIDPDMAEGWQLMAWIYALRSSLDGSTTPVKAFETVQLAVQRLSELAPGTTETLGWQIVVEWFSGKTPAAFRRAGAKAAQYPNAFAPAFHHGSYLGQVGYSTKAAEMLRRATEIDPLFATAWFQRGLAAQAAGDYEAAEQYLLQALELGDGGALAGLAWNDLELYGPEAAKTRFMLLFEALGAQVDGEIGGSAIWEAVSRANFDKSPSDIQALRGLLTLQYSAPGFESSFTSLSAAAQLGLIEDFFKQFDEAYIARDTLTYQIWSDFDWAQAIRQHPGFPAFVEKQGFLAIWQEHGWPDKCRPDAGADGSDGAFTCD